MTVVILQSNYVPWKGYFDLIHDADKFVFYDCVQYTKNDWRNRNVIYTRNGKQWLTIPVSASAVKGSIDEVSLDDDSWQELHFRTLLYGYKRAPFFEQLLELMEDYLQRKKWKSLSQLNQYLIPTISKKLGCTTEFIDSRELSPDGDRLERLIDILTKLGATRYISGKAASSYIMGHEHLFQENGIELVYKEYPNYMPYRQLAMPFENGVSILDLVANLKWDNIPNHIWNL
jgi:hypothetical protein